MLKNIAVGQVVYFEDHEKTRHILCGTVKNIEQETLSSSPLRVHTEVIIEYFKPEVSCFSYTTRRSPAFLFESRNDCERQMLIDSGELDIRYEYRNQIKSVKDLMVFIFSNDIIRNGKCAARDVALEKTKELLGYDHIDGLIGAIEV